jgi:hypothetical protein
MRNGRNTELQWPDFYPENCPPAEAEPASGTVYRLVKHNPPQAVEKSHVTWWIPIEAEPWLVFVVISE